MKKTQEVKHTKRLLRRFDREGEVSQGLHLAFREVAHLLSLLSEEDQEEALFGLRKLLESRDCAVRATWGLP